MIKIQPIVRNIVMSELEAYVALTNGYMNMSSYAHRIRPLVEEHAKKQVTITSLVVSLSRLRKEFKKEKPLIQEVVIANITTKLPLTDIVYENTDSIISKLESFHKKISISREDFFTTTISTTELNIICSSNIAGKVLKHFGIKPKFTAQNLAAVGISFSEKQFTIPNTLFSLYSVIARARINIIEVVSTYTELIFIIEEKNFSQTVALFSELHRKVNRE
ncbi:hypothetical protein A2W67_03015 [Candidatus Nomurabacteria bacterium RIFCSPLOWO2_02_40_28]|uniref:Aspartate kinase n=2 Tax=Candidatus Nomuraibacteriota TaxID=1752729 RepID=A0A837HUM5_9BACT|nr:MAG: hypothetical protein UT27_C0002G0060 [Candidatus Nomurabacteria bacterium GW2011_GWD2_39_12]KKR21016.1 MAG: hypothetical protein UT51_C0001G0154 [Candidatus Nomurabacteria bacterium GW2011_GWC2_39_41]KKR37019.1 MAG: hypothetical protein UT70_C0004G0062 [Candidatus Nomurabacteria bacterium GW2011_GWE2_40_10]KKR38965.1 MAG: hypothetical protein UT73_C0001G0153 [Candidatus Nomurabacteria bacterium GW2011_GWB1_40_11]KKR40207.1 MAG: hypothetical protein UT74_C0002G0102 [Parcubacteria group b